MKKSEIREKAERILEEKRNKRILLSRCIDAKICPNCGEDITYGVTTKGVFIFSSNYYYYECTVCGWSYEKEIIDVCPF